MWALRGLYIVDDIRKKAYRHLLYVAMLSTRTYCQSHGAKSLNPFTWYKAYIHSRYAGATADWLHNLAEYSCRDFQNFNEKEFWLDCERKAKHHPKSNILEYKRIFKNFLNNNVQIC